MELLLKTGRLAAILAISVPAVAGLLVLPASALAQPAQRSGPVTKPLTPPPFRSVAPYARPSGQPAQLSRIQVPSFVAPPLSKPAPAAQHWGSSRYDLPSRPVQPPVGVSSSYGYRQQGTANNVYRGHSGPGNYGGYGSHRSPAPRVYGSGWAYSPGYRWGYRYPSIGWTVPLLGAGAIALTYAGSRWYWDQSVWYQPSSTGYMVSAPPIGAIVPSLPAGYASIIYNGVPYFYSGATYYVEVPGQGYRIVTPPSELPPLSAYPDSATVQTFPSAAPGAAYPFPDLAVAPLAGQSTSQFYSDRADCSRWASGQSGYDPSQAQTNDAMAYERAGAYRDAEASCLRGRGYEVR